MFTIARFEKTLLLSGSATYRAWGEGDFGQLAGHRVGRWPARAVAKVARESQLARVNRRWSLAVSRRLDSAGLSVLATACPDFVTENVFLFAIKIWMYSRGLPLGFPALKSSGLLVRLL